MAGDESAIPLLLGLGLHEFSLSASSILPARELIGQLSWKEWSFLVDQALALTTQEEILAFVRNHKQGGQIT
jgi:phosphotransferase system enzyme I (PtsI)